MKRRFFGTDGIRGEAFQGLLAKDRISAYGQAIGVWLAGRLHDGKVLVGRDTRESGPELQSLLVSGIVASGHHVIDGGILPTPAVQRLCRDLGCDLAIVISASHNPSKDNGIKFFGPDGRKLPDADEISIEDHILSALQQSLAPVASKAGSRSVDLRLPSMYAETLAGRFRDLDLRGRKIVADCAHGAASWIAPEVLRRLGAEVIARGVDPDGRNINDGCGVFFVEELGEVVRDSGAAAGFALDGDADRALMVDETGAVRDGDHLLGLLACHLASEGRLAANLLVTTVMANYGLKVFLEERGIGCEMTPVGDRFVAEAMAKSGAVLGGEQSGHIIFREGDAWIGDGLYTVLRTLEVLDARGESLAKAASGIEKFPQQLVNVRVSERVPIEEVPAILDAKRRAEGRMGRDGRVLLRYSGTELLLRVMVEGRDRDLVAILAQDLADAVQDALPMPDVP